MAKINSKYMYTNLVEPRKWCRCVNERITSVGCWTIDKSKIQEKLVNFVNGAVHSKKSCDSLLVLKKREK